MSSNLFLAGALIMVCSLTKFKVPVSPYFLTSNTVAHPDNIVDFSARRLSGGRVYISWRTEGEPGGVQFEVMRKPDKIAPFMSLGTVGPKETSYDKSVVVYSFIDTNNSSDTSYYCLKKKNEEGIVFFSLSRAVEGMGKHR